VRRWRECLSFPRRVPAADAAKLRGIYFCRWSARLGWRSTPRRLAQLTRMLNNRPPCHYCGNCVNGCDVGAMFNPVAVTLPPALKTGNLEVLTDSVVARVRMNNENRPQGVTYIERHTMKSVDVDAKYVVLAASTLENTRLMLLSAKGGLANSSGLLGYYMRTSQRGRRERNHSQAQGRAEPSGNSNGDAGDLPSFQTARPALELGNDSAHAAPADLVHHVVAKQATWSWPGLPSPRAASTGCSRASTPQEPRTSHRRPPISWCGARCKSRLAGDSRCSSALARPPNPSEPRGFSFQSRRQGHRNRIEHRAHIAAIDAITAIVARRTVVQHARQLGQPPRRGAPTQGARSSGKNRFRAI